MTHMYVSAYSRMRFKKMAPPTSVSPLSTVPQQCTTPPPTHLNTIPPSRRTAALLSTPAVLSDQSPAHRATDAAPLLPSSCHTKLSHDARGQGKTSHQMNSSVLPSIIQVLVTSLCHSSLIIKETQLQSCDLRLGLLVIDST